MWGSHLIEKLKYGERYVLVDIVIRPLSTVPNATLSVEQEVPARNKYLTRHQWQTFVYRRLYELFSENLPAVDGGADDWMKTEALSMEGQAYEWRFEEQPYLVMKCEFKGITFRDNLNAVFRESANRLHRSSMYVEIFDEGQSVVEKLDERDRTVMRLVKEIEQLKMPRINGSAAGGEPQEVSPARYRPSPVVRPKQAKGKTAQEDQHDDQSLADMFNKRDRKTVQWLKAEVEGSKAPSVAVETQKTAVAKYRPTAGVKPKKVKYESQHSEYVPTAVNGLSPTKVGEYRAMRIDKTNAVKQSPVPYQPTSEVSDPKVQYIPSGTPPTASAGEEKRKKRQNLFGSDEDEPAGNGDMSPISSEDMFGLDPQQSECPVTTRMREILPRTSKQNGSGVLISKGRRPTASWTKRKKMATSDEDDHELIPKEKRRPGRTAKNVIAPSESIGSPEQSSTPESDLTEFKNVATSQEEDHARIIKDLRRGGVPYQSTRSPRLSLSPPAVENPERRSLEQVDVLDCTELTTEQILETFERYGAELRHIFDCYKDRSQRYLMASKKLCNYHDVSGILLEEQKLTMMQHLEKEFVPEKDRGRYTEFFSAHLVMEWALRLFMAKYNYASRQLAIEQIRLQERIHPLSTVATEGLFTLTGKKKR